jgi:hypothetical protein
LEFRRRIELAATPDNCVFAADMDLQELNCSEEEAKAPLSLKTQNLVAFKEEEKKDIPGQEN